MGPFLLSSYETKGPYPHAT